jgi:hypothetical protein
MVTCYSHRINVVSSRSLVEILFLRGAGVTTTLKLNPEKAGALFRELFYRGKVTLEATQKTAAFL